MDKVVGNILLRKWLVIGFFLSPTLFIYLFVMLLPLLETLRLSFFRLDSSNNVVFSGISNYVLLFGDAFWSEQFFNAFYNNIRFFIIHMLIQNPIAILLAGVLSTKGLRGGAFYRAAIFMPAILSYVIVGYIWKFILSPTWGLAPSVLDILGLGDLYKPWLGLESSALYTLAFISIWQFIGIPILLIYAALLRIPNEIMEAARCDGMRGISNFFIIKLPLIMPTVILVGILTFVTSFNAFDLIYAVQGALAGPNYSTDLLGTLFFRTFLGFQMQSADSHLGATISSVMFFIILMGVSIYLFFVQKKLLRYRS